MCQLAKCEQSVKKTYRAAEEGCVNMQCEQSIKKTHGAAKGRCVNLFGPSGRRLGMPLVAPLGCDCTCTETTQHSLNTPTHVV